MSAFDDADVSPSAAPSVLAPNALAPSALAPLAPSALAPLAPRGEAAKIAKIAKESDFSPSGGGAASSTTPLVARKLSLRVSGARAGDVARPSDSGPLAAGSIVRASDPYALPTGSSRRGLRVNARGTTPPPLANSNAAAHTHELTEMPRVGIQRSLLGDLGGSPFGSEAAGSEHAGGERAGTARSASAPNDDDAYPWER